MSRGPGHVERAILAEIERWRKDFPVHVTSWGIAIHCYPRPLGTMDLQPTPAQHKAVARAMHSFVRKFPQYALLGGQGRKRLHLYERADPMSVLWAQLAVERRGFVCFQDVRQVAEARATAPAPPP